MRNTKSTVVKSKNGVYVRGEVWSPERYRRDMDRRNAYNRKTYRQIQVRLRRDTTPDILNWAEIIPNFNLYIRDLIRADLKKRIKRGEIELDMKTGGIKVLKPMKDIEPMRTECDDWNIDEESLGKAEDIWSIKRERGRRKKNVEEDDEEE